MFKKTATKDKIFHKKSMDYYFSYCAGNIYMCFFSTSLKALWKNCLKNIVL